MNNPTVFISGHLDISKEEWRQHYKDEIDNAIKNGYDFVIGDSRGTDKISAEYLRTKNVMNVTIYYTYNKPINNLGYNLIGNFKSHTDRDSRMTQDSTRDIAWVRSKESSKKLYGKKYRSNRVSGTQKNINRRNSYRGSK